MSVSIPLSPSSRDFLVYQRIVIDGASTRTVADELQISQTRVRQVVQRVMEWLTQTLPADAELSQAAWLRLAQHIAADRLERFYVEANRAWTQTAEPKFASLCIRVIAAQTKLPAMPGTLEALAMDAILGPLSDEHLSSREQTCSRAAPSDASAGRRMHEEVATGERNAPVPSSGKKTAQRPTSAPPLRDCSPTSSTKPATAANSAMAPVTTPAATGTSDKLPATTRAARSQFLTPAHPLQPADDEPVLQLKVTPKTSASRPRNTSHANSAAACGAWQRPNSSIGA